jgi:NAD(P)-dependent dehydrogenase (short-subunit alcohol dehydrogenase family)
VAFVTGAASGIGRAVAERFAEEGAHVVAADIRYEGAAEAASGLAGGLAVEIDVVASASVASAFRVAVERFGGLDVLVNCAGVLGFGAAHELDEDDWDRCLDVNLKGSYLTARAAWPYLAARGGGAIVNLGSVLGVSPLRADAPYCVSKAGVIMLTRCLALDGAPVGIRANCVSPGYTMTPMTRSALERADDPELAYRTALARHPLGRLGEPDDIAGAILYLASGDAGWVTGVNLLVDGGYAAGVATST